MAAYASRARMESFVFCTDDTPPINVHKIAAQGAATFLVNGLINDSGKIIDAGKEAMGWFDTSPLKAPFALRARKRWDLNWRTSWATTYETLSSTRRVGGRG